MEKNALSESSQSPSVTQSRLKQIQSSYRPVQDRLLIRFSTTDRAEFSLWFTRRFVGLIWPPMMQILSSSGLVKSMETPQARQVTLGFEHQVALSKADFSSKYEENAVSWPLGKEPLLIVTLEIKKTNENQFTFCFRHQQGRSLNILLQRETIHSLCKLLIEASEKGGWKLGLKLTQPTLETPVHETPTLQ